MSFDTMSVEDRNTVEAAIKAADRAHHARCKADPSTEGIAISHLIHNDDTAAAYAGVAR